MKDAKLPRMSRGVVRATSLLLLAIACQQSWAREYRFTTIADSNDPRFAGASIVSSGVPTIDNNGTVYFLGRSAEGHHGILSGNGGPLSTVIDNSGPLDRAFHIELSVNASGTVAFLGQLDTGEFGVFSANNGTLTTIADSSGRFTDFRGTDINDQGEVAFTGLGDEFIGIYKGQGGPLTTIAERNASSSVDDPRPDFHQEPSINNHGDVAFFGQPHDDDGIYVGDGEQLKKVVSPETGYRNFLPVSRSPINDAGMIAFIADGFGRVDYPEDLPDPPVILIRDGAAPMEERLGPIRGVFVYNGGNVEQVVGIADSESSFGLLNDVMINNAGDVAFGSIDDGINSPLNGIFTGPDPVTDKVIAVGDMLSGSRVTYVQFYSRGLNDRGEIAFFAQTESGTGYYRATPVPEPAPVLLMAMGAIFVWRCVSRVNCRPERG